MHDCFEAGMIINKDNTISVTLSGEDFVFLQIRMNQIRGRAGANSSGRKRSRIQLACKAWLTDWI
jgi:hypothetical protein